MNTQQLIGWINEPESLGKEAGAQLDSLTQSFPYFQTAHLLFIKSLHNQNSFLYNNQLKVAAAYATNRKVLYELITTKKSEVRSPEFEVGSQKSEIGSQKPEVEKEKTIVPEVKVETEKPVQPEFPKKRFVSNPDDWEAGMIRQLQLLHHWKTTPGQQKTEEPVKESVATEQILQPVAAEKTETKLPEEKIEVKTEEEKPTAADEINTLLYVLVEPSGSEDIPETEEETVSENLPEEKTEEPAQWEITPVVEETAAAQIDIEVPKDVVQQEIIREAISSSIEMEVDDTLPSPAELMVKPRVQAEEEITPPVAEPEEEIAPLPEEDAVPDVPDEALSGFASWLKMVNAGQLPAAEKTEISEEKKVTEEPKTEKPKEKEQNIIERFIREEPRIKPQKTSFYSPVNMAKKSVQESDEFITETLARIYAKQGNTSKAIRAYQKLSLKFPEKSSYFAALIEELKRTPNK